MKYGCEQYMVYGICPDIAIGEHWKKMHSKEYMNDMISAVLKSEMEEDFRFVHGYFQTQNNPPIIRFSKKNGEQGNFISRKVYL